MPVINSALGLVGLATRSQLDKAVDRKDRWHGLVRDVFGQYYLKFRESSLGNMPELPTKYSAGWESHIRAELDAFLHLDLESVGELLEACGFGTEKWEKLQETGFPALRRLLDDVAESGEVPAPHNGNGHAAVSDEDLTQAVNEDVLDLLQQHPDLAEEMIRRIDLDSGRLLLDREDLEESESFQELQAHHEAALDELKRFRRGGRQALDQIRELQTHVEQLQGQSLDLPTSEIDPDHERDVANLRMELRAREASSAALRDKIDALEGQLADVGDPDQTLREALAATEQDMQEKDDTIVRLQARVERLETQLEEDPALDVDEESDQLRELRSTLKSREHEIESLRSDIEETRSTSLSGGDEAELKAQIDELQSQLQARDHSLQTLREELERLQNKSASGRQDGTSVGDDDEDDPKQLRNLLAARDSTIAGLREEVARLEEELESDTPVTDEEPEVGDVQQLRNDLRARDHSIETLREQISKLEADLARVERRAGGGGGEGEEGEGAGAGSRGDAHLADQVQSLQGELAARDGTILDLRKQLHAFEAELGQARDQLLAEVGKLKALTSGDLELKPSAELDEMDSGELLGYARDVAEDLDVRRQTLDEGLQGIESVKGSYEESKKVYQDQEQEMHDQLESLRSELDTYQQQQERDEAAGNADSHDTIVKQREQLDVLSTRIRQLVAGNQELNESNKKMYENLEQAVKRVIPLRKQIEELDSLNEALQRYIRQTHDRTFTTRKLAEAGVAP